MAIKRLIIELDDVPDMARSTTPPESLIEQRKVSLENQNTGIPEQQEDYREPGALENQPGGPRPPEMVVGRTLPDLVFKFINRPEFMPTMLTVLAFMIFVRKIQTLNDFWLPMSAAAVLNLIWFGVTMIRRITGTL